MLRRLLGDNVSLELNRVPSALGGGRYSLLLEKYLWIQV
jgi:hypothetical protein